MSLNRYANTRFSGPNRRGFTPTMAMASEGKIPVVVAVRHNEKAFDVPASMGHHVIMEHYRGFYLHPTKGWRSTGPKGVS